MKTRVYHETNLMLFLRDPLLGSAKPGILRLLQRHVAFMACILQTAFQTNQLLLYNLKLFFSLKLSTECVKTTGGSFSLYTSVMLQHGRRFKQVSE